jgi:hypothetical protein
MISGIIVPTKSEETALASILDKKVCDIFPSEQVEAD